MDSHSDNFDFLRLAASVMVIFSHAYPLNGAVESHAVGFLNALTLGTLGVAIFFCISGYLVFGSWVRDPAIHRFAWRRALRIYPGLIAVVLLSMLVLGPLVTSLPLTQYFQHQGLLNYLNVLLLFPMEYRLPGVFLSNPYAGAVNGSLWSLPVEVLMYGLLLVLAVAGRRFARSPAYWLALQLGMVCGFLTINASHSVWYLSIARVCQFGAFFFGGVALAAWARQGGRPPLLAAGLCTLLLLYAGDSPWTMPLALLVLPCVVIAVGIRAWPALRRVGRFGDFSYGIYIYAFPVQQTVVWLNLGRSSYLENTLWVLALTTVCAALSWHCIEKPCLRHKPRTQPQRA